MVPRNRVPVTPPGTDGIDQYGSVRSSAGCRFCTGIAGLRIFTGSTEGIFSVSHMFAAIVMLLAWQYRGIFFCV